MRVLSEVQTLQIRPFNFDDTPAVVTLLFRALPLEDVTPAKFARNVINDPNRTDQSAWVAEVDGEIVGFIYGAARKRPLNDIDARRGYITVFAVAEQFRRRGVATQLIELAEDAIRSLGRSEVVVSPYAPLYFTPGVDVHAYPPAVRMLSARGYQEISRPISMRCDLRNIIEPQFVETARARAGENGVRFAAVSEQTASQVIHFANEEFGPDWADVYVETWARIRLGDAPSRIMVAHRNDEILGISHHDADRFGPIGVAKAARHQRIGQILMYETLKAQRAAGHNSAYFLWSDDSTAARLYSGAGFVEVRRFLILRKVLSQ